MPRYFFNVRDGFELDMDDEGVEFPDLEAARAEALAAVEELRDEFTAEVVHVELEVSDESGRKLLTLPLSRGTGDR
jgi:hypothetical protein